MTQQGRCWSASSAARTSCCAPAPTSRNRRCPPRRRAGCGSSTWRRRSGGRSVFLRALRRLPRELTGGRRLVRRADDPLARVSRRLRERLTRCGRATGSPRPSSPEPADCVPGLRRGADRSHAGPLGARRRGRAGGIGPRGLPRAGRRRRARAAVPAGGRADALRPAHSLAGDESLRARLAAAGGQRRAKALAEVADGLEETYRARGAPPRPGGQPRHPRAPRAGTSSTAICTCTPTTPQTARRRWSCWRPQRRGGSGDRHHRPQRDLGGPEAREIAERIGGTR